MNKKPSDEQWLLNPKGIRSITVKDDILVSGSEAGEIMIWPWPLKPSSSRKQKVSFDFGRRTFGKPKKQKTVKCLVPQMRASYIVTQNGEEFINAIDIAGDKIAVASGDYMARIYNKSSNELVADFWAMKPMHSVAISDKYCAYSSREGSGIVTLPSMEVIDESHDFYGKYYLRNLAIKNEWVIGGSYEGITVFDIKSGELVYNLTTGIEESEQRSFVQKFSINGDYIVGNGTQNQIFIWDLNTGDQVTKFPGPPIHISSVIMGGDLVAAANIDGKVFVWDLKTGEKIAELESTLGFCNDLLIHTGKLGLASSILEIWDL